MDCESRGILTIFSVALPLFWLNSFTSFSFSRNGRCCCSGLLRLFLRCFGITFMFFFEIYYRSITHFAVLFVFPFILFISYFPNGARPLWVAICFLLLIYRVFAYLLSLFFLLMFFYLLYFGHCTRHIRLDCGVLKFLLYFSLLDFHPYIRFYLDSLLQ